MRYILCVGAHPDDVEGSIGGTVTLMRQRGDIVRFLSVTDGGKGHYREDYATNPVCWSKDAWQKRNGRLHWSGQILCVSAPPMEECM
jgi:LmbE family N-acetylglucosaminyl deacetylase